MGHESNTMSGREWMDFSDEEDTSVQSVHSSTILPVAPIGGVSIGQIPAPRTPRFELETNLGLEPDHRQPNRSAALSGQTPALGTPIVKDPNRPSAAGVFVQSTLNLESNKPALDDTKRNYVRGSSRPPKANNPFKKAHTPATDTNLKMSAVTHADSTGTDSRSTIQPPTVAPGLRLDVLAALFLGNEVQNNRPDNTLTTPLPTQSPHRTLTNQMAQTEATKVYLKPQTSFRPSLQSVLALFDTLDLGSEPLPTPAPLVSPPLTPTAPVLVDSKNIDWSKEPLFASPRANDLFHKSLLATLTDATQPRDNFVSPRKSFTDMLRDSYPPQPTYTKVASTNPTTARPACSVTPAMIPPILRQKLPQDFTPETTPKPQIAGDLKAVWKKVATSVRATTNTILAKKSVVSTLSSQVSKLISSVTTPLSNRLKEVRTWLSDENSKIFSFTKGLCLPSYVTPALIAATVAGASVAAYQSSHTTYQRPVVSPDSTASIGHRPIAALSTISRPPRASPIHTTQNRRPTKIEPTIPHTVSVRVDGGTPDSAVRYASHALGISPSTTLRNQANDACAGTNGPSLLTISLDGGVTCRPRSHSTVIASQGSQKRKR